MIASSPWYASATGWTALGVLVAVVAIVVTLILRRRGEPRGLIAYAVPLAAPLLTGQWHGADFEHADLALMLQGKKVSDPYVVGLRVESRSRKDIRTADFDQGSPLTFNFGAKILSASADASDPRLNRLNFQVVDDEIQVLPTLIRRGELLRLTILTDGRPKIGFKNPIVDVDVREQSSRDGQERAANILIGAGALIVAVTFVVMVINQPSDNGLILAFFILFIGLSVSICGGAVMIIRTWIAYSASKKKSSTNSSAQAS